MDLVSRALARQKSGGRKKAMPNKLKADAVAASTSGLLPLDYMLSVMRDPTASTELRLAMAARALPYCHARLKSVEPPRPAPNLPTEITIHFVDPCPEHAGSVSSTSTASDNEDVEAMIVGRNCRLASS
jgi:hypothetical protein